MVKSSRVPGIPPCQDRASCDALATGAESALLEVALGNAIRRNALSVEYQPQFDLRSGWGCGVEALARWVLPTGDRVAPSVFIPLAESTGLIHSLGAWVLNSACATARAWSRLETPLTTLSVNVSALQINRHFVRVIEECLQRSGLPGAQLELEITESALIGDTDVTLQHFKQWKDLGIQIALDDFGTGYSSLSYLSRLPIDRLKLDQSLIHRMTVDRKTAIIVRAILALAVDLGIEVLAEGIETERQLAMITDLGCARAQGYLLGRPMPAAQAQVVLRRSWGDRPPHAARAPDTLAGERRLH